MEFSITDRDFIVLCKEFLKSKMSIRGFCKECDFTISRSGFHKQIHSRLPQLDKRLYIEIDKKLHENFKNRHSFGSRGSGYEKVKD